VSTGLAQATAAERGLDRAATLALSESWKTTATYVFNLGGLIGTLLTIPAAKLLGRRMMFGIYYGLSGIAVMMTFGLDLPPLARLYMYFFIGLTVFGVFGSFTYYLPELFPTRLRGTGAGFCYNVGRITWPPRGSVLGRDDRGARQRRARERDAPLSVLRRRRCRSSACCCPGRQDQGPPGWREARPSPASTRSSPAC
jgi:hypothetical protein